MMPNEAFWKYFPDTELIGIENRADRSSCLQIGTYAVIRQIIHDYKLEQMLGLYFNERDMGLLFDLATYAIVEESNISL